MTIKEIIEATEGVLVKGNLEGSVKNIKTDTRIIEEGDAYIALLGARDGHDFINTVEDKCNLVIVSKDIETSIPNVIKVEDTLKALGDIGRYIRIKSKAKVVGITGSVGKTSTKDMIYSVIKEKYKVLKTEGNFNNHIGVPLTLLRYNGEDVMVIEMGMNHLGEISYLTNIAKPNIGVITNVGTAHIGELGSRENILKAKMEITEGLSGTLIVNGDNDMLSSVTYPDIIKVTKDMVNDIHLYEEYSTFKYGKYLVTVPVPGMHFIYNALIGIEVGKNLDIPMKDIIRGIENFELTKNRNDIIKLNKYTLIDGTYNANLDSMKSSIDVLSTYNTRQVAILGDMLELGSYDEKLHREVGKYLIEKNIDLVLLVGSSTKYIMEELNNKIECYHVNSNNELIDLVDKKLLNGDTILVKASNGMKLKEIVEYLKKEE